MNPENAFFSNKKILNRIDEAKNLQKIIKKDYFKKFDF